MSLRKITKNRGLFPTRGKVLKLFSLAIQNFSKKWSMPTKDWKAALNRFTIKFDERLINSVYTKSRTPSVLVIITRKIASACSIQYERSTFEQAPRFACASIDNRI